MFNKKGISPLIATVLVIGFTIVLAALVIQWGGQLVDKIKGETEITSELSLLCSTGLAELKITKVDPPAGTPSVIKVTIDNKNDREIEGIVFRRYIKDPTTSEESVESWEMTDPITGKPNDPGLSPFAVVPYNVDASTAGIYKIGALPKVKLSDNSVKTCSKELTALVPV